MVSNLPAFQSMNHHKEISWEPKGPCVDYLYFSIFCNIISEDRFCYYHWWKKIAKVVCEKPQWTRKQSCLSNFQILGTFTPLMQSFIPMNKAKYKCTNAQTAVKCFKYKLPSSYSCLANSVQMKLPAPKLKHSQWMARNTFNLGFHNEGYTWERQIHNKSRLIYTALQKKNPQGNVSPIAGKGESKHKA